MHNKDIVIIGNGIAAKCVVFYLNKLGYNNITLVADDATAPRCSTRSTAINCLRGTKPGKSELGDLILRSFSDFEDFYNSSLPDGIVKSTEIHTTPVATKNQAKWDRRYKDYERVSSFNCFSKNLNEDYFFVENEAYFITPEILFEWFDQNIKYSLVNDYIVKVENKKLFTKSGNNIDFDKLIICSSFMSKEFADLIQDDLIKHRLMHSKPVPGTYLKFNLKDFDALELNLEKTYCFRIDDIHLIVRTLSQDVLIGATSTNNTLDFNHNLVGIKEQYNRLSHYLKGIVELPDFELGEVITGVRHKGQMRTPFWGEVNSDVYAVWGLYKNAYTFAFTAGKEIADLIQK